MKLFTSIGRPISKSKWFTRPDNYEAPLNVDESKIEKEFARYGSLIGSDTNSRPVQAVSATTAAL
jgi:hypothetical protein